MPNYNLWDVLQVNDVSPCLVVGIRKPGYGWWITYKWKNILDWRYEIIQNDVNKHNHLSEKEIREWLTNTPEFGVTYFIHAESKLIKTVRKCCHAT